MPGSCCPVLRGTSIHPLYTKLTDRIFHLNCINYKVSADNLMNTWSLLEYPTTKHDKLCDQLSQYHQGPWHMELINSHINYTISDCNSGVCVCVCVCVCVYIYIYNKCLIITNDKSLKLQKHSTCQLSQPSRYMLTVQQYTTAHIFV